jgi:hypothetical protein
LRRASLFHVDGDSAGALFARVDGARPGQSRWASTSAKRNKKEEKNEK